jgi:hypothetical protein
MADENGADALDDATQGDEGAADAPTTEDTAQQPDKSFDVEDFAGRMGWSPKDQWRGPPDAWKPADEFIEGTVSVNQSLSKKLKNLERNHAAHGQANEQLAEQRIARCDRSWRRGSIRPLTKATRKPSSTSRHRSSSSISERPASDPDVADFVERHSEWFNVDPEATALAMGVADNLAKQGKTAAEQVAAAEKAVKKRFPELFDEPPPASKARGPQRSTPPTPVPRHGGAAPRGSPSFRPTRSKQHSGWRAKVAAHATNTPSSIGRRTPDGTPKRPRTPRGRRDAGASSPPRWHTGSHDRAEARDSRGHSRGKPRPSVSLDQRHRPTAPQPDRPRRLGQG